jgi:hypothetical protein
MHRRFHDLVTSFLSWLAALVMPRGPTPPPKDEPIADSLVQGLEIACRPNHAARTSEPLVAHLQHAAPLNETELMGSLKAIINNGFAALGMKDMMLLEWMRHLVRHNLHQKYPDMIEAIYCLCSFMFAWWRSLAVLCVCVLCR